MNEWQDWRNMVLWIVCMLVACLAMILWVAALDAMLSGCSHVDRAKPRTMPTEIATPIEIAPVVPSLPALPALYDAMLFADKPTTAELGMRPIRMVYKSELWPAGSDDSQADETRVKAIAAKVAPGAVLCFDIEHWPVDDANIEATIDKLIAVADWAHAAAPTAKVGFYAIMPIRDYWTPVQAKPDQLAKWHARNAKFARLAEHVDVIFPSLYTFYDKPDAWVIYARANIAEAARFGKPVIAFLWPQYHDSNAALHHTLIDGAFWQTQLDTTIDAGVAGVGIWGGVLPKGGRLTWDAQSPWWRATIETFHLPTTSFVPLPSGRLTGGSIHTAPIAAYQAHVNRAAECGTKSQSSRRFYFAANSEVLP
ncbi:MAG: hypothetical protein GC162_10320 [Planctomycetes bacterium]|nr:hypothetical protein [Planctomycetota bacterium]